MMLVAFSGGVGMEGRVLCCISWWREWWGIEAEMVAW